MEKVMRGWRVEMVGVEGQRVVVECDAYDEEGAEAVARVLVDETVRVVGVEPVVRAGPENARDARLAAPAVVVGMVMHAIAAWDGGKGEEPLCGADPSTLGWGQCTAADMLGWGPVNCAGCLAVRAGRAGGG